MSFLPSVHDLGDIYEMRVTVLLIVPTRENGRVQEFSLLDLKLIDHLALQC